MSATAEDIQRWEALGGKVEERPRGNTKRVDRTYLAPSGAPAPAPRGPRAAAPHRPMRLQRRPDRSRPVGRALARPQARAPLEWR
jgi:hypothetical protein